MFRWLFHPAAAWGLLAAYAGCIFYVSAQPIGGEGVIPHLDKLLHAMEYGLFGALAYHALQVSRSSGGRYGNLLLAIGLSVAYGISDELHQYFVPTRDMSYADLVADAIGAAGGAWIMAKHGWNVRRAEQTNR
ncbi:MAG: VanZ family protein [Nitrospirota bacterium]